MGNTDTKLTYRQAVLELTGRGSEPIDSNDEEFWSQFFHENHIDSITDVFTLLTAQEIRQLRDESPANLSTLCYKAVEQLVHITDTLCNTSSQHRTVLTCSALLTRILPYLFEDPDWRGFFWTKLPSKKSSTKNNTNDNTYLERFQRQSSSSKSSSIGTIGNLEILNQHIPLAHSLLLAIADLLFCPDFTVAPLDSNGNKFGSPDTPPEDLQSIDSCEYIWEAGVGCSIASPSTTIYDQNRTQLLRLLLTCFSESMYCSAQQVGHEPNRWIQFFTGPENRHALPLFTSLLNTVFAYNPNSILPFNYLLFNDTKEPLVEVCLQILIVILDHDFVSTSSSSTGTSNNSGQEYTNNHHQQTNRKSLQIPQMQLSQQQDNLFINYISRIHREDDFEFILKGFTRLLNNPLQQSYIPNSTKKIQFHQELLVLFWKICDYNKKFMYYVLKTCDVLKILVPILYHLNDARADRSRVGLVHIGVFIILLLSGERNFGVRLNRPYLASIPMDLPIFSGTHADLLIIVFHKLITTGHQRLQPLFDCLLTILVNVSPYLKTLSMVAAAKILHLLEAFSTPWFLFSNPTNHHLVFFLLEIFNNIIQYQFDGNSNLVYMIIRKRQVFHSLTNLPTDYCSIKKSLSQAKIQQLQQLEQQQSSTLPSTSGITTSHSTNQIMKRFPKQIKKQQPRPMSLIETNTNKNNSFDYHLNNNNNNNDFNNGEAFIPGSLSSTSSTKTRSNPTTPIKKLNDNSNFANFDDDNDVDDDDDDNLSVAKSIPLPSPISSQINDMDLMNLGESPSSSINNNNNSNGNNQTMNITLAAVPKLEKMTERTHPTKSQDSIGIDDHHQQFNDDEDDHQDNDDDDNDNLMIINKRGHLTQQQKQHSVESNDNDNHSSPTTASTSKISKNQQLQHQLSTTSTSGGVQQQQWHPTTEWILSWKQKLPLQTILRMLQVLVPQVEKMCLDKGITDENEILKFLQHGTLVGLLPVPHPILIRKYQTNIGTTIWFRTYMWGIIYLRNSDPPIWYDTEVRLFEIQKS